MTDLDTVTDLDTALASCITRLYSFQPWPTSMHDVLSYSGFSGTSLASFVVFHPPPVMPVVDSASLLARISLPLVYDPNVNGPEDVANLTLDIGSTLIGRYEIVAVLADGSSSRVYRSLDLLTNGMVAVKVRLH